MPGAKYERRRPQAEEKPASTVVPSYGNGMWEFDEPGLMARRDVWSRTMTMLYVAGLWRYPVKTLAGERLAAAALSADGVHGDRLVQVHGPEGVRTS
ncbi:MAG: MOSC N-terminal beta barrel domain-containing protein, partial [Acidobacteriota bacterium]